MIILYTLEHLQHDPNYSPLNSWMNSPDTARTKFSHPRRTSQQQRNQLERKRRPNQRQKNQQQRKQPSQRSQQPSHQQKRRQPSQKPRRHQRRSKLFQTSVCRGYSATKSPFKGYPIYSKRICNCCTLVIKLNLAEPYPFLYFSLNFALVSEIFFGVKLFPLFVLFHSL